MVTVGVQRAALGPPAPKSRRFSGLLPQRMLRWRRPVWWQELAIIGVGYWLYTLGPQCRARAGVDRPAARAQRPAPAGHVAPELGTVHQPLRRAQRVARAGDGLLLRDAALRRHDRRDGLAVRPSAAHLSRRTHGAVLHDARRTARLLSVPARAAPVAARSTTTSTPCRSSTPGAPSPTRTSPSIPTSSPPCPACTSRGHCGAGSRSSPWRSTPGCGASAWRIRSSPSR